MIEINELVIQVPSMGEREGMLLANQVGEALLHRLSPAGSNNHIEEIHVRMANNAGTSAGQMADSIATQIVAQLNSR